MERLTIPDEPIEGGMRRAVIDAREVRKHAMTIYWQLKKYEDTGLIPEEIMDGRLLTGWIPVTEQLPEPGNRCLVTGIWKYGDFEKRSVYDAVYEIDKIWHTYDSYLPVNDRIIAWMPLPEPYREEKEYE